jgi:hypothetical protein
MAHGVSSPTARTRSEKTISNAAVTRPLPGDVQEQLDAQSLDIDRILNMIENFRRDVDQVRGLLADLQEVQAKPEPPQAESIPTASFEQLADTITRVSAKASEVDILRTEVELIKAKILRSEECGTPASMKIARSISVLKHPEKERGTASGAPSIKLKSNIASEQRQIQHSNPQNLKSVKDAPKTNSSRHGPIASNNTRALKASSSSAAEWRGPGAPIQKDSDTSRHVPSGNVEVVITPKPPLTDTTNGKRKRQPPPRPSDLVDWSSIEDAVLISLEDNDSQSKRSNSIGRLSGDGSGFRDEDVRPRISYRPSAEPDVSTKKRKAEMTARDLEAQSIMEREEMMSQTALC